MLLTIDTLDSQGQPCSSTYGVAAIEDSASFLEVLLSQQYLLLRAHVWKNNTRTSLSLDAFAGALGERVPTLLQHWQAHLSTSPLGALPQSHTETVIGLTRRRIIQHLDSIASHEYMITHYNHCIQQVQETTCSQQRAYSINQKNNLNVIRHQQQVHKLQGFLERSTRRLNQLSA